MQHVGRCRGKVKLKELCSGYQVLGASIVSQQLLGLMEEPEWRSEDRSQDFIFGTYKAVASNFEPGQRIEAVSRMNMKYVGEGSLRDGDGAIYFRFQSH